MRCHSSSLSHIESYHSSFIPLTQGTQTIHWFVARSIQLTSTICAPSIHRRCDTIDWHFDWCCSLMILVPIVFSSPLLHRSPSPPFVFTTMMSPSMNSSVVSSTFNRMVALLILCGNFYFVSFLVDWIDDGIVLFPIHPYHIISYHAFPPFLPPSSLPLNVTSDGLYHISTSPPFEYGDNHHHRVAFHHNLITAHHEWTYSTPHPLLLPPSFFMFPPSTMEAIPCHWCWWWWSWLELGTQHHHRMKGMAIRNVSPIHWHIVIHWKLFHCLPVLGMLH